MGFLEDIANKIRVWADNRYAPIGSSGGGLTIENNGTALPERSQLNIIGKNLFSTDTNENKMLLFQELPKDMRFDLSNPAFLDCIWMHTDGYWYIVGNVLSSDVADPFVFLNTIRVVKTVDWMKFDTVFEHTKALSSNKATVPRIVVDAAGNIIVVGSQVAASPDIRTFYFWEAVTQSVTALNVTVNSTASNFTKISSTALKSDGSVGLASFGRNGGSYDQLFYIERSPGVNGSLGAIERIGVVPVRAIVDTSTIHLFYGSDSEPRIVFLNNASATSSKVSVAKRSSGVWKVYDTTITTAMQAAMDASNNIYIAHNGTNPQVFVDASNSYVSAPKSVTGQSIACVGNTAYNSMTIFNSALSLYSVGAYSYAVGKYSSPSTLESLKYFKATLIAPGSHVVPLTQISLMAMYNRQRLDNAYALIFRMDGSMFMEQVSW